MAYGIDTADRRRRRALRAVTPLAALLVAALLIWQGSNAAFSATTDNTNDTWSTGNLVLTNNGGGTVYSGSTAALFTESNRKPGDTGFKCITVHSGGSLAGNLRLYRGAITGTNGAALAAVIDVTVDAVVADPSHQRPGQLLRVHRWHHRHHFQRHSELDADHLRGRHRRRSGRRPATGRLPNRMDDQQRSRQHGPEFIGNRQPELGDQLIPAGN